MRIGAPAVGMTLIEALVALALMAILAVGILTTFRIGGRVYNQVTRLDASARDTVSVQQFLTRTLESAYPLHPHPGRLTTEYGLEGTEQTLKFLAPMPQSSGSAGHYRYELSVEPAEGSSSNLLVRWSLARGRSSAGPIDGRNAEVLLEKIDSLEWSYLETVDPTSGLSVSPRWLPTWMATARLPTLVRLRVRFPPGDARSWPEFVAAPRITDDAGCEFDAISQLCRDDRS
jgi:general secretion pathway protein J